MNWLRKLLHPVPARLPSEVELQRTKEHYRATIRKADRVLEEYRKLDAALVLHVHK